MNDASIYVIKTHFDLILSFILTPTHKCGLEFKFKCPKVEELFKKISSAILEAHAFSPSLQHNEIKIGKENLLFIEVRAFRLLFPL